MSGELLHTYSRKRLAAMARNRQVSGWHDMRKADLIKALQDENPPPQSPPERDQDTPSNWGRETLSRPPTSRQANQSSHQPRQIVSHVLLRTVDRDENKFSAVAVSAHWIRAEWSVIRDALRRVECALGPARHTAQPVLRLYELSDDERLTHAVTFVSDTNIPADAQEWYVQVDRPGRTYQVQLGVLAEDGDFYRLESSGPIDTSQPVNGTHPTRGRHAPPRSWRVSRDNNEAAQQNGLPLWIDVELVIRGRTDPQSSLMVANDRIDVESDGTFEHSLPLAEGRQVIPTTATSLERRSRRTVVVAIQRHTRRLDPQGPDDH